MDHIILFIIQILLKKLTLKKLKQKKYNDEIIDLNEIFPNITAHQISLVDLHGNELTYSFEEKLTRPVVINFWAAWCGPSKRELPILNKIYEEFSEKIDFVSINIDSDVEDAMFKIDTMFMLYP